MFVDAHQRAGLTFTAGTTGTANTVHIVFRHVGQFIVHHVRQFADVNAACGDISCAQHLQLAGLEFSQSPSTCSLALVAVYRHRRDAIFGQVFCQVIRAMLGTGKHQYLEPVMVLDQFGQQLTLALTIHRVNFLGNQFCCRITARNFYHCRFVEQAICQPLDLVGEGGGEQQVLSLLGQYRKNLFDVANKAHIQHAIGFIQYQNFNV